MAAKGHTVGVQLTPVGQTEHLIAAGVGQNRSVPAHKVMQASQAFDPLVTGAQIKMVGIGQQDGSAQFSQVARLKRLDVGGSAHRGKGRHLYGTVRRVKGRAARLAVGTMNLKVELCGHIGLESGRQNFWQQKSRKNAIAFLLLCQCSFFKSA